MNKFRISYHMNYQTSHSCSRKKSLNFRCSPTTFCSAIRGNFGFFWITQWFTEVHNALIIIFCMMMDGPLWSLEIRACVQKSSLSLFFDWSTRLLLILTYRRRPTQRSSNTNRVIRAGPHFDFVPSFRHSRRRFTLVYPCFCYC